MARLIESRHHVTLDAYESYAHLAFTVHQLREEVRKLLPALKGRRLWMLNSTEHGGGVAEMLPSIVTLMRELGVDANWLVMRTDKPEFFQLTKRLHNLIHGQGDPALGAAERELYDSVSRETAQAAGRHLAPGDVLVVHDPQPMGAGAILRNEMDIAAIWRCHIGLDRETEATRAAWTFLDPCATPYDRAVFTAPEYIPGCLSGRATIIHPAIDPLSHKNRDLPIHKLVGILACGALVEAPEEMLVPPFSHPVQRLQPDGRWALATQPEDFSLLFRPVVTQVSRWDRLKGFLPLMQGFVSLKEKLRHGVNPYGRGLHALELVQLVLAGPDPASIEDDPEGKEVLGELCRAYGALHPAMQREIALVTLPMASEKHNALLVNALQRCSDIVVQNSLQEGFGLTATEAMWKRVAVIGTRAAGLRQQIRHDIDGWLVQDPEDPQEIAHALEALLRDDRKREALGRSAQQRVHDEFLIFTKIRRWLELIAETVGARWG